MIPWVTNWRSHDISVFRPREDGTLPPARIRRGPSGAENPLGAVLAPDGRRLYVSNWGSADVSVFEVGSRGGLRPLDRCAPAPPTPTNSAGIAVAPDGEHLYVTNFNNGGPGTLSIFAVTRRSRPRPHGG